MKILMEQSDIHKLPNVRLAIDVEADGLITIVATQQCMDGSFKVFHQDQFHTPE